MSSNARIFLKRGSASLFSSSASRQQRLALHTFSRLIPNPNSSNFSSYPSFLCNNNSRVQVKSNGKMAFPDTLAMVMRLEAQGIPSKQADAITLAITEVLDDSLENLVRSFVSKEEMQKSAMTRDVRLSEFKSEMLNSQEHHFSLFLHEIEMLRADMEKAQIESRYDREKLRANNEKALSELRYVICENASLALKEIYASRAQWEAAKYQLIKYSIGSLVLLFGPALAVHILM